MMSAFNSQMVQKIHYKYTRTYICRKREGDRERERRK